MKNFLLLTIGFVFALTLGACSTNTVKTQNRGELLSALDIKPDGYSAVIQATGEKYRIESTQISAHELCRVVALSKPGSTLQMETFCKPKGEQWR